ncbi:hypothetical protein Bca101_067888 [Brassica carinata]
MEVVSSHVTWGTGGPNEVDWSHVETVGFYPRFLLIALALLNVIALVVGDNCPDIADHFSYAGSGCHKSPPRQRRPKSELFHRLLSHGGLVDLRRNTEERWIKQRGDYGNSICRRNSNVAGVCYCLLGSQEKATSKAERN